MRSSLWSYQFVRYFLRLFIPLIILLSAVLWLLFRTQVVATLEKMQANEIQTLHFANRTIDTVLGVLRGDALFLTDHSSLHQWLDSGDSEVKAHLAADFLAFARRRHLYDQVRFLDEHGMEVVRINLSGDQPMITPPEQLQDQSEYDFVQNTLALDDEVVLLSPFMLNTEQGVIEQPIKPTIHLSAPVIDKQNQKRGLIVLNYRGQRLLNRLRILSEQNSGELWLLNSEGYWLIGPRPELEWSFMYPDRQPLRFNDEFGEALWLSFINGSQFGQFMHENGLYTYSRVSPAASQNSTGSEDWLLVSYISPTVISASTAEYGRNLVIAFIGLTLLLVLLNGVIAFSIVRRRQAEHEVRNSEARFRGLLESAPDAIVITDQPGKIELVNSQTEQWFGYKRDELLGKQVEQLLAEQSRKQQPVEQNSDTAIPFTQLIKSGSELFGMRRDGSEFPIEISLSPLATDQGLFMISIIRDISMRKQAEAAQRWLQTQYQDLVNNLPIGVFRSRPEANGKFIEVNSAMVDIFEADSVEQLLTHSFGELYCDLAERKLFVGKVLLQGHVHSEEIRMRTLKGKEFDAALTAVTKKNDAGEIYFDGIVQDISVRKESENQIRQLNDSLQMRSTELEAINHELEAFSYSVSHDLRAPLRAMDGFSRTLLEEYADQLDDKGRDRLHRIRAGAQRMAELIDDLLTLSRVSRRELKWQEVDLTQLANQVLSLLQQEEPQRDVHFSVQSGLISQGDPQLLRIMMDNLLGNAWKFTGRCQQTIIEVGSKKRGKKTVFFIRDNGAGFDMAYVDKLFGAFQRLHDASEYPGTGIGLATVQRVIHKHGGQVWAESAIGQGATFYFTLDEKKVL